MKKAVWISFFVALVVVNALAEAMDYFADVQVAMFYRLVFVLSITVVAAVFAGSVVLVDKLGQEKPLSGHVRDTLGEDRLESTDETGGSS